MKKQSVSLTHPILFVMDYRNSGVVIPEYSIDSVVSATSSCISVKALADIDGEVTVILQSSQDGSLPDCAVIVFDGLLATPARKLAVVSADNEIVLEADVIGETTKIKVAVDDSRFPSQVWVETDEPRARIPID